MQTNQTMTERLVEAICRGDLEGMGKLLQAGADPTAPLDRSGLTPLHFAIEKVFLPAIDMLLLYGVDPRQNRWQADDSPLEFAAQHTDPRPYQRLIRYAAPAHQDMKGSAHQDG